MRAVRWAVPAAALVAVLAGCASGGGARVVDPALEVAALAATAPTVPLRVVFDWRLRDGDARYGGQGVLRVEPPDRVRLDLFGPQGEGLLSAAVVGEEIRLPAAAQTVELPPPVMLWGALGVVAPPEGALLAETTRDNERVSLAYAVANGRLEFELVAGRLRRVRWDGPDRRLSVELAGDGGRGTPREALFRDWSAFVELVLEVREVEDVDPYPGDVWVPGC